MVMSPTRWEVGLMAVALVAMGAGTAPELICGAQPSASRLTVSQFGFSLHETPSDPTPARAPTSCNWLKMPPKAGDNTSREFAQPPAIRSSRTDPRTPVLHFYQRQARQ